MENRKQQSLKTEKYNPNLMRGVIILCCIIFLASSVSSIQYFQQKLLMNDTITTLNFGSATFVENPNDAIVDGTPHESYISYHVYPDFWNRINPNANVSYCNLRVIYLYNNTGGMTEIYNMNFTSSIQDGKYFVQLFPKDAYYVYATCIFSSPSARNNSKLEMPFDFNIVMATKGCKACQFYEFLEMSKKVDKAIMLSDYTTRNVGHIKGLFNQFYEIILTAFWIILIMLVISAVGLMFLGIYWLYTYFMKVTK